MFTKLVMVLSAIFLTACGGGGGSENYSTEKTRAIRDKGDGHTYLLWRGEIVAHCDGFIEAVAFVPVKSTALHADNEAFGVWFELHGESSSIRTQQKGILRGGTTSASLSENVFKPGATLELYGISPEGSVTTYSHGEVRWRMECFGGT